ncbi:MAG: hypothetical protein RL720_237 [Actinomycetota bacterium]|jgi:TfoX/Sxy family transcriptional regulator of competence genes
MSTTKEFTELVHDALGARDIRIKPMFGEYGLYCEDKFVGVMCDNTLFLKLTEPGQAFAPELETGSPYPGAQAHLIVPESRFEDAQWMHDVLSITYDSLPKPKPKTAKK